MGSSCSPRSGVQGGVVHALGLRQPNGHKPPVLWRFGVQIRNYRRPGVLLSMTSKGLSQYVYILFLSVDYNCFYSLFLYPNLV